MGGIFDKETQSSTSPDLPDFVWDFLEKQLGRYSQWADQGASQFLGGEDGGYVPTVGGTATPGRTIGSYLNPNFYDQNTGKFIGGDPPPIKDLMQQECMSQEEATQFLENWGSDVDPNDYFYVMDESGEVIGSYKEMEQQIGDFWKEHARPVVGASDEELEAARRAGTLDQLPEGYQQGMGLLQTMLGLDPNEELARSLLLENYDRTTDSELPEWARAYREAGAQDIDITDITQGDTYDQLYATFQDALAPAVDSSLAGLGLGRSSARGAAMGQAFAPYVSNLIGQAIGVETGNRAAEMQGIEGGASILADDLNRALQSTQLTSGGLMDLGSTAKNRIGQVAEGYFGTGAAEQAARQNSIAALSSLGGTFRGYDQEAAQSPWEDWMRRAAAFESSIGGPLGMVPSMFGATTTANKKPNK